MRQWPEHLTPLDRSLNRFTPLRPGEGRSVAVFFSYALLMMLSYYILKTIREPLLLTGSSAEAKSYAYAVVALLLLFIVPLYGVAFRNLGKDRMTRFLTGFFLLNLLAFLLAGRAGLDIGFAYYVWVGIFSVMVTAQFWGFAADSYNVKSGQRLFPLIMVGATLGGLLAPSLSGLLFPKVGPWVLMVCAMVLLGATVPLVSRGRAAIPAGSNSLEAPQQEQPRGGLLGGIGLVFTDRYLFLLAVLITLLNWVNTTGEYILAELLVHHADARIALDPTLHKGDLIAGFYGNFFFTVNLLTLLSQVFLVARVTRWVGLGRAVMILPVIALVGYGLVAFVPIFSLLRLVKITENATDYSLMNTTRHALYLPLSVADKYEGKTAIEAFFWRFGDLVQAGVIYAGLHWFGFGVPQFAVLNSVLSVVWLMVAFRLAGEYRQRAVSMTHGRPPRLERAPEEQPAPPGRVFEYRLPKETFSAVEEGDVLVFRAHTQGSLILPVWLDFDAETLTFSGIPPKASPERTEIVVRAADFDGDFAEARLVLRHRA